MAIYRGLLIFACLCGLGAARAEPVVIAPGIDTREASKIERVALRGITPEAAAAFGPQLATRLYAPGAEPFRNRLAVEVTGGEASLFAVDVAKASLGGATLLVTVGESRYARAWPAAGKTHEVQTVFTVPVPTGDQTVIIEATNGVVVVARYLWLPEPADRAGLELVALEPAGATPLVPQGRTDAESAAWDGYRGCWFDLGQKTEWGSKYSGGLGTYTGKHRPLAVHDAVRQRTYFTYGGRHDESGDLQIMVSYFDHATGRVPRPTRVMRWLAYNDPHCNAALTLDRDGYIWVFVSGRGRGRAGYKFRSVAPHDIAGFEVMSTEEMTYPQVWYHPDRGFFHMFTKYTSGRELYWETGDPAGQEWTDDHKLAGFGGHYETSALRPDGLMVTFFNYHHERSVDKRTNLYYAQSADWGATWTTADGTPLEVPIATVDGPARVRDYLAEGRLCYVKDATFDQAGRPVSLHLTSGGYAAGPAAMPRVWRVTRWTGNGWHDVDVCVSDHNYDLGSLYIDGDTWFVIAPTERGPQPWGTGGEMALWVSRDDGATWRRETEITRWSLRNHGYARRPEGWRDPFCAFWADGDPTKPSESLLYFCDSTGQRVYQLPAVMEGEWAEPIPVTVHR